MRSTGNGEGPHDARLEMILQQIGALPTLSPVAVRVLSLGQSGDVDLREVGRVISSDPALSGKVLRLCKRADLGISNKITTVERAVVMLGLEAVRAAVLSVEVHAVFEKSLEGAGAKEGGGEFDRVGLWRHSLAVACAAELLASGNAAEMGSFSPSEAFLAGLLHDLGKLALDAVLPQTYAKVAELTASRQGNVVEIERAVIGLDHHTAGKRLAEHWGLPHALQDVIWLHGQSRQTLPEVWHQPLIRAVTAADGLARHLHLGWSGNFCGADDPESWCASQGFSLSSMGQWERTLVDRVGQRSADLGLDDGASESALLSALSRANSRLGRLTTLLEDRSRRGERGAAAMERLGEFFEQTRTGSGLFGAMEAVGRSAARCLGPGALVLVIQSRSGASWSLHRIDGEGRPSEQVAITPPRELERLSDLLESGEETTTRASALSWLAGRACELCPAKEYRLLPLAWGNGLSAAMLHDRSDAAVRLTETGLRVLGSAWGSALCAAAKHEGARRLGEQLADANRRLSETQSRLVQADALSRLGEMTAGAAHEMNNPLTVISGQAQLLRGALSDESQRGALSAIVEAADRLSDLIAGLHQFASPPALRRRATEVIELLRVSADEARVRVGAEGRSDDSSVAEVRIESSFEALMAHVDPEQLCLAATEVIVNALQASPRGVVEVRVHTDPLDDRLCIAVIDDGVGMTAHASKHAFDPFFSELPAGRRRGLGLTRAKRCVELHGGQIVLESAPGKGTSVRLSIPGWRVVEGRASRREAA